MRSRAEQVSIQIALSMGPERTRVLPGSARPFERTSVGESVVVTIIP